jgi:hypothetical protein
MNADEFDATQPVEDHWRALAEFRRAIEPEDVIDAEMPANQDMAGLSMTAFLRGLEVRIADRFSISPDASLGQFEIVPYSAQRLDDEGVLEAAISEDHAELTGEALAVFQHRLHTRGARAAYQLGNNSYLVIDRGTAPMLEELARAQKAPREERRAFIQNPRAFITEAVNRHLEASGALDGLDAAGQEEMVEAIAGPVPPRKNAKPWKTVTAGAVARNEALRASKYLGRAIWRNWSGYHRRSRVETNPLGTLLRNALPGSGCTV